MKRLLLILACLLTLSVAIAHSSNYACHPYYSQSYSYPVYQAPPVYNVYNNYIPYAVPLYSSGAYQPTAVISGAVAYQQTVTAVTSATAGAASSVQSVLGAEVGLNQQAQASQDGRFDRLLAAVEKLAGISGPQAQQQQTEPPHIAVLRANCADCHSGANARKQFQIFDDSRKFVLAPDQIGKVLFRLSTNKVDPVSKKSLRMPPDQKLPQDVHDAIVEGLVTAPPEQARNGKVEPMPVAEPAPPESAPKKEEGF